MSMSDVFPGVKYRLRSSGTASGVTISGGIQHAKYILTDGTATYLGSQNMDWRSLEHIHELGVLIHDEHVTQMFQPVFEMDLNHIRRIGPIRLHRRLERYGPNWGCAPPFASGTPR